MVATLAVSPIESRVAEAVAAGALPVASADLTSFHPTVVVTHGARRMALAYDWSHGAVATATPDVASMADEAGLEIGLVLRFKMAICFFFLLSLFFFIYKT